MVSHNHLNIDSARLQTALAAVGAELGVPLLRRRLQLRLLPSHHPWQMLSEDTISQDQQSLVASAMLRMAGSQAARVADIASQW